MKRHFTKILISGAFIGGSFVTIREYCHNNLLNFVEKFKVHAASKSNESHTSSVEPESKSEPKLVMTQVFFRHGARLPITDLPGFDDVTYDNDFVMAPVPYATIDVNVTDLSGNERPYSALEAHYSKYKMKGGRRGGGLTALGRDQCYLLGKRLRERYVEKLGLSSTFDPNQIYVRSTNTDRTIESAQSTLAGMFGQTGFKSVPNIQVAPDNVEILYANSHQCKVLKEAMTCARMTLARTHHDPWLLPLLKEVTEHMGWKGDERWHGYVDMMGVRDHLVVRRLYGLPIPKFYEERESQINDAAIITIRYLMAGTKWTEPIVLKVSTGPVLRLIQSNISDALSQKSKSKMYMYSCHDSSLIPLLVAFGCYKHHWPQYGADLCIELYEDTAGKRWVKLVYCDEEQVPESSNTGALVPLEQFEAMLARYAPNTMEDYYENCSSPRCFQELASVCVVDAIKTSPAKLGTAIPAN